MLSVSNKSKCLVWQAVTNTTRSTCKAHNVGIMRVLLPGNEFGAKTRALSTAHRTPARQLWLWGSSVSTRAISRAPHVPTTKTVIDSKKSLLSNAVVMFFSHSPIVLSNQR